MLITSVEMTRCDLMLVSCLCMQFAVATGLETASLVLGGHQRENAVRRASTASESHRTEELHRLFVEAQLERQRQRYSHADALYEAVATSTANASFESHALRMWVQYQHADLLMRHVVPQVEREHGRQASDRIKDQALAKFQDALQLCETANLPTGGVVFGVAERVHSYNSVGTLAMELGKYGDAIESFRHAITADPTAYAPLGNLALVLLKVGHVQEAFKMNERALKLKPDDLELLHNMGTVLFELGDETEAENYWVQILERHPDSPETLASLATIYGSRGDVERAQELLRRADELTSPGPLQQSIRLQRAMSHLRMIYNSADQIAASRHQFKAALSSIQQHVGRLPDPLTTIGSGSMGYYAIYQGYHDRDVRSLLAQIYRDTARDDLSFVAPHVRSGRRKRYDFTMSSSSATSILSTRRRVRVGFLSAFLRHHSVGLLLSGVMRHLPRDQFDVVAIMFDDMPQDSLTQSVLNAADQSLLLPARDLRSSQRLISSLELDILVFSEIGMHASTYFLAFSQLALRSVAFWGHAVTSGIDTVDYFVSSKLFRQHPDSMKDRERYTECLYEMEGLTTLFPRPPAPETGLTRASFGLPDESVMAHMLLVPQTLYKLHPDFDFIIQRILSTVESSFLVLPIGDKPLLVQQLTRRWREGRIITGDVYKRIFFVRKLNQTEFLALCAMSDLVLDPFPVGGGRSSFEVFSVGTPILGLTSRTTILQLTLAMYRRMGIETTCCMFETEDDVVAEAMELLRSAQKRHTLRDRILRNNHKLYAGSNYAVVREWEQFFHTILANDAPGQLVKADDLTSRECIVHEAHALHPRLVYETFVSSATPASTMLPVRLFDGDDPFDVASLVTSDILQVAYLGKMLWNMQQRFLHRVIESFDFKSRSSGSVFHIEIREGDDLHQVVRWQVQQALRQQPPVPETDNSYDLEARVLAAVTTRVPQHTTRAWRAARAMVPPRSFANMAVFRRRDCVALVVTTCKRLSLFLKTMASLRDALKITQDNPWHDWFCSITIIDDNSSEADRQQMMKAYPSFHFIWKSPMHKGHARSLNLALAHIRDARFLFYLEDDWEFRRQPTAGGFLLDAVSVLRSTPLAQVLLNDQGGGHTSHLTTDAGHSIQHATHEFAVADPAHDFSYWPGFSLNPGVWDLHKLSVVFQELQHNGDQSLFQENTDIFEREFSLRVWRSGLEIGYLKRGVVCDHIGAPPGTNASAYVLNGLPRRFDLAVG